MPLSVAESGLSFEGQREQTYTNTLLRKVVCKRVERVMASPCPFQHKRRAISFTPIVRLLLYISLADCPI